MNQGSNDNSLTKKTIAGEDDFPPKENHSLTDPCKSSGSQQQSSQSLSTDEICILNENDKHTSKHVRKCVPLLFKKKISCIGLLGNFYCAIFILSDFLSFSFPIFERLSWVMILIAAIVGGLTMWKQVLCIVCLLY